MSDRDAERDGDCKFCDGELEYWIDQSGSLETVQFCPFCGRKLESETKHRTDECEGNLDTAVMLIEDAQTTIPFVDDRVEEIEKARDELNAWLDKHGDRDE